MTLLRQEYKCDIVPPQIFVGEYKSFSIANEKSATDVFNDTDRGI